MQILTLGEDVSIKQLIYIYPLKQFECFRKCGGEVGYVLRVKFIEILFELANIALVGLHGHVKTRY